MSALPLPPSPPRLHDGRLAPGTLVQTPHGQHGQVLPYDTRYSTSPGSDSVFVHLLTTPERPWLLISSAELTVLTEND